MTGAERSVAVSGATSFTGTLIALAFAGRGWRVEALCPRGPDDYTGVRALRLGLLRSTAGVRLHHGARAEDGGMARWIRIQRPAIWIHHHHPMENFRSADYDMAHAERVGVAPIREIIAALAEGGARGVIHSGTFFEPGEGGTTEARATAYGRSKRRVWELLHECASARRMPLSKVVIPNPIGPFESPDRIVPLLLRAALADEVFTLRSPASVSDYLPGASLAALYVDLAESLLNGDVTIARPSGIVLDLERWVARVSRELVGDRLRLPSPRIVTAVAGEPTDHRNPEREQLPIDWAAVWDDYAAQLSRVGIGTAVAL